ncbi:MAG: hypothetical protein QM756_36990 [Polyangiaceae bacterium]
MSSRGATPGVIESSAVGPRIVKTTISGHATLKLSESGLAEFVQIVSKMQAPIWVSDARGLTGYDSDSLGFGRNWFSEFKGRQGRHLVIVSEWSIALMAAHAMALGFGIRLDSAATLEGAIEKAHQLLG